MNGLEINLKEGFTYLVETGRQFNRSNPLIAEIKILKITKNCVKVSWNGNIEWMYLSRLRSTEFNFIEVLTKKV